MNFGFRSCVICCYYSSFHCHFRSERQPTTEECGFEIATMYHTLQWTGLMWTLVCFLQKVWNSLNAWMRIFTWIFFRETTCMHIGCLNCSKQKSVMGLSAISSVSMQLNKLSLYPCCSVTRGAFSQLVCLRFRRLWWCLWNEFFSDQKTWIYCHWTPSKQMQSALLVFSHAKEHLPWLIPRTAHFHLGTASCNFLQHQSALEFSFR